MAAVPRHGHGGSLRHAAPSRRTARGPDAPHGPLAREVPPERPPGLRPLLGLGGERPAAQRGVPRPDKDCAPAVAVCFLTAPHTRRAQPRYVKFLDAEWTLDGAQEPGLYPIVPETRKWFLDKGRKYSVLEVQRKQILLVPAFAITAHASQGKTLPLGSVEACRNPVFR